MWKSLSASKEDVLYRGNRIRIEVLPNHGEDQCVDFMIFHAQCNASDGFSLLRVSGYKSGHVGVTLPEESRPDGINGISVKWLTKHWKKWMPVDGKATNIWVGSKPARSILRR
jgi:hypothetical protein